MSMSWPPPKLHSCRWGWCCLNFDSNSDLVHHVVYDHVINSIPVRRRDVHMLRRAEEGIGSESLTLSGVMHIETPQIENAFNRIDGFFFFTGKTSSLRSLFFSSSFDCPATITAV